MEQALLLRPDRLFEGIVRSNHLVATRRKQASPVNNETVSTPSLRSRDQGLHLRHDLRLHLLRLVLALERPTERRPPQSSERHHLNVGARLPVVPVLGPLNPPQGPGAEHGSAYRDQQGDPQRTRHPFMIRPGEQARRRSGRSPLPARPALGTGRAGVYVPTVPRETPVRYFYDTEFIEDGRTIDLVSIGIVAEDGREFYAVSNEFSQPSLWANDWLRNHVWPSLPTRPCAAGCRCTGKGAGHLDTDDPDVRPRAQIARAVLDFILGKDRQPTTFGPLPDVQLWADYAAYDHVALAQLYGPMIKLPEGMPMWTNDIQQEAARLGVRDALPNMVKGREHNALDDARLTRDRWRFLAEQPAFIA